MTDPIREQTFDVELSGCRPEPLAFYLKALGVFRLVAEQKDRDARGSWLGEAFVLRSRLDRGALLTFFIEEWQPTPVVAPWNGGSGFWPSTSDEALRSIEASTGPRLAAYRAAIALAKNAIKVLNLDDVPEKGESKARLLTYLRANVAEEALGWLDAVAVLTDGEPIYPALLGSGGNDGRQDFSNNFMKRVLAVLDGSCSPAAALFGAWARTGTKGSMGQFSPSSLERSDGWDFILAIEGSLVLAGAATRRLESAGGGSLAFPFHARASLAPSLSEGEGGEGCELWLPRWSTPATFRDVRRLFAEGRAKSTGRSARTGLDFARSIASFGVDRGLSEFVRFSIQRRNGKNHFATPLGRFSTHDVPAARPLDEITNWYDGLRLKSTGKNVPVSVALARRRLEQAMFEAVERGGLGPVLLALGDAEFALAKSLGFTAKAFLHPIKPLSSAWGRGAIDSSVEQRLAAALARRPGIRWRLLPLDKSGRRFGRADEGGFVFADRPLVDNLHALLLREDIEAMQQAQPLAVEEPGCARCSLTDIARFIDGDVDDALVERWLRALILVDGGLTPDVPADTVRPPTSFAVLALVHNRRLGEDRLPRTATVLSLACAGDAARATEAAVRRLNASTEPLPVRGLVEPTARMRRIAAALAFPLTVRQRRTLESMVLPTIGAATTNTTTTKSLQEPA